MYDNATVPKTLSRLRRLSKKRKRQRKLPGAAPGKIIQSPDADKTKALMRIYDGDSTSQHVLLTVADLPDISASKSIVWLDVQGLYNVELIEIIAKHFGLHPLVTSDLVHTGQRPKTEIHDHYIVVILREPRGGPPFDSEQIAIVIGANFVLTFQERSGDIFDPVRKRMQAGSKRLREMGAAYLAYALIDTTIDGYFPILEAYGELTETLEQKVILEPHPSLITDIHILKRELLDMRRALWSQREAVNVLLRDDAELIPDALKVYLRDCADHSFQLLDMVEVYREVSQGLVDLHLSSVSNRMNEIMKVLTVIATIFIPMTFIAGVYGMNFDRSSLFNLPELGWKFGYLFALGLMAISSTIMLIYFWRKGWIGKNKR